MRKLFTMLMLCAAVFAFTGCKEKTDEAKAKDAAEEIKKDGEKAAGDMQKDAEKAAEDGKKKLDGLMGK